MKNQSGTIKTNLELYRVVMGGSGDYKSLPGGSAHFSLQTNRQTLHHNIYIIINIGALFWSLLVICKEDSPNDDFLDQKRPNMAGSSVFLGGPKGPKWPKMVNLTVIHCESQNALCVFRARIQVLSEIVQNVSNWSTRIPDDQIHLGPLLFTIWATLEL